MAIRDRLAAWLRDRARPGEGGPQALAAPVRKAAGGTLVFTGAEAEAGERGADRGYRALARDGFMVNPVVYRATRMIGEATAAIPLVLYDGDVALQAHPIRDLLRRPNPLVDGQALIETIAGHLILAGEAHVEAVALDGVVRGLHAIRPDHVRIEADRDGWPATYVLGEGARLRRIAAEPGGGAPPSLLSIRLFHPFSATAGHAPAAAAHGSVALHNAALRWNRSLLENSARPSGALVYQPDEGGALAPDQFERLKVELEAGYQGASRAGRPMLLEGGLDWKAMALSPKDMDFVEARNGAARDIALALGVPPMLLGIPGDNTYANYAEANRAFYRLTVVPMLTRLCSALGDWLAAHHGEPALRLAPDLDRAEGLSAERDALWRRLDAADFLTRGEKRSAVGYDPDG